MPATSKPVVGRPVSTWNSQQLRSMAWAEGLSDSAAEEFAAVHPD